MTTAGKVKNPRSWPSASFSVGEDKWICLSLRNPAFQNELSKFSISDMDFKYDFSEKSSKYEKRDPSFECSNGHFHTSHHHHHHHKGDLGMGHLATFGVSRCHPLGWSCTILESTIYCFGCVVGKYQATSPHVNKFDLDSPNDGWKSGLPMHTNGLSSVQPVSLVVDGKIYVLGGNFSGQELLDEVFDAREEKWDRLPLPTPFHGDRFESGKSLICAVLEDPNRIFVTSPNLDCFYTYDVKERCWKRFSNFEIRSNFPDNPGIRIGTKPYIGLNLLRGGKLIADDLVDGEWLHGRVKGITRDCDWGYFAIRHVRVTNWSI